MNEPLKAPFPWFGAKSKIASIIWQRFGPIKNYVEPFFGSGAVLLRKPDHVKCIETINDKDAYVANFWRAIKHDPDEVAKWADNPVNENDLHARHIWLVQRKETLRSQVEGDPDYYDARIAGYWVYGVCCTIGRGYCSGIGPWSLDDKKRLLKLSNDDIGIDRIIVFLGSRRGMLKSNINIRSWFQMLSDRLKEVRVASGDWFRIIGPMPTTCLGLTGMFFDPPYTMKAKRDNDIYTIDDTSIGNDVFDWAVKNGDNPLLRIALCGYEGEYVFPDSWNEFRWKGSNGFNPNKENKNRFRERIWFSPHCLPEKDIQLGLFDR